MREPIELHAAEQAAGRAAPGAAWGLLPARRRPSRGCGDPDARRALAAAAVRGERPGRGRRASLSEAERDRRAEALQGIVREPEPDVRLLAGEPRLGLEVVPDRAAGSSWTLEAGIVLAYRPYVVDLDRRSLGYRADSDVVGAGEALSEKPLDLCLLR